MKKRREMIEHMTPRDHIEHAEIRKTIKKKAREDIRKHNLDEIRETIEATKSLKKVRRTQSLGNNRMITLLDKQGKEIQEQDKIMERIEEYYLELYDSDQAVTITNRPRRSTTNNGMGSGSRAEENEKWERSGRRSSQH